MTGQGKPEKFNDELIREALARDFESIEAPPADECWRRIEAGLHGRRSPGQKPGFGWARYTAVAAAVLLLIALSSIGILQVTDIAAPMAEEAPLEEVQVEKTPGEEAPVEDALVEDAPVEEAPVEEVPVEEAPVRATDEKTDALQVEETEAPEEAEEFEVALEEETAEPAAFEVAADPSPPEWEQVINGNLHFEEAVLLNAGDGPDYQGAVYRGEEEKLLWVKSQVEQEKPNSFIEHLVEHIQAESLKIEVINGYIYFEVAGQPGLAWQEDDQNQALVVLSGLISRQELENITSELD